MNKIPYLLFFVFFVSCFAKPPQSSDPVYSETDVPQHSSDTDLGHHLANSTNQTAENQTDEDCPCKSSKNTAHSVPPSHQSDIISSESIPSSPHSTSPQTPPSPAQTLNDLITQSSELPPLQPSSPSSSNIETELDDLILTPQAEGVIPYSIPYAGSTGGLQPSTVKKLRCVDPSNQNHFDLFIHQYNVPKVGEHPICEVIQKSQNKIEIVTYAHYQRTHCMQYVKQKRDDLSSTHRCE